MCAVFVTGYDSSEMKGSLASDFGWVKMGKELGDFLRCLVGT